MKRSQIAKLYALEQARRQQLNTKRTARKVVGESGYKSASSNQTPSTASQEQFERFTASELYCPKCKSANPVKERLLLVLPDGELYEYRCQKCGTSVGERKTSS